MLSNIIEFVLCSLGLIGILLTIIFKTLSVKTENLTITLPLRKPDSSIYEKIYNIYSILDFMGLKKHSTIVLVNYGAPKWFCDEINEYYKEYNLVKIINNCDAASNLF